MTTQNDWRAPYGDYRKKTSAAASSKPPRYLRRYVAGQSDASAFDAQEVLDAISEPFRGTRKNWLAEFCENLDAFLEGCELSVGEDPFDKDAHALIARVAPVEDEFWDMRVTAPKPGIRAFGAFAELNTFICLTWEYRDVIADFLRGFFRDQVLEKLAIFENGLLCEGNCDNSVLDEFLTEFVESTNAQGFRRKFVNLTGVKAYLSQMEVTSSANFERTFSKLNSIGPAVGASLSSYGQKASEYTFRSFRMHYDVTVNTTLGAPEFIFERRSGSAFSSKAFFASAPVRTEEHLKMLSSLEALLS